MPTEVRPHARLRSLVLRLACAAALAVCLHSPANADVVELSPDTYFISRTSWAGVFVNMSKLKAAVIREANEFARRQGKIAIPISANEHPPVPGRLPYFEYQFRVVAADDPEAQRTSLVPRPDLVIEDNHKIDADIHTKTEPASPDLYTQLLKLDDLHKRGILTDEEFEAQKKKVLEASK